MNYCSFVFYQPLFSLICYGFQCFLVSCFLLLIGIRDNEIVFGLVFSLGFICAVYGYLLTLPMLLFYAVLRTNGVSTNDLKVIRCLMSLAALGLLGFAEFYSEDSWWEQDIYFPSK